MHSLVKPISSKGKQKCSGKTHDSTPLFIYYLTRVLKTILAALIDLPIWFLHGYVESVGEASDYGIVPGFGSCLYL